jgi:hypothetical protein
MTLLLKEIALGVIACARRLEILKYALPCIVIWFLYLLAFWPGLMSQDSVAQWDQVVKTSFSNNYPAFHTLTNWLITRLWLSPAAIAIFQIISLAVVFGVTIYELKLWGIGPRIRALTTAVFSLSPVNGMMVISLWKDIPYTCAMLGLFAIVLRLVRTEGRWLLTSAGMVILCGVAVLTALFRHNGLPVMALFFFIMMIVWRKVCFKQLLRVSVNWLLIVIIITGPVYRLVGVLPMAKFFALQNIMHQIGAMASGGAIASKADRRFLASIQPIAGWVKFYNCYSLNVLIYNQYVQHQFIQTHAPQLIALWMRLILKRPEIVWEHQKCVTSMLWQIPEPQDKEGRLYTTELGIVENDYNLHTQSRLSEVHDLIYDLVEKSRDPKMIWFVWRPVLYLYGLLLCIGLATIRSRNLKILQASLPAILNTLVWMALITTQDFRFQYPVYVMALIAPALLFIPKQIPTPLLKSLN